MINILRVYFVHTRPIKFFLSTSYEKLSYVSHFFTNVSKGPLKTDSFRVGHILGSRKLWTKNSIACPRLHLMHSNKNCPPEDERYKINNLCENLDYRTKTSPKWYWNRDGSCTELRTELTSKRDGRLNKYLGYTVPSLFLYFKVKNHTTAPGRVVTGDLLARTNWRVISENIPARNRSSVRCATVPSLVQTIFHFIWNDTNKVRNVRCEWIFELTRIKWK